MKEKEPLISGRERDVNTDTVETTSNCESNRMTNVVTEIYFVEGKRTKIRKTLHKVGFMRIYVFRDEKLSSCGETVTHRPGVTSKKTRMLHHTRSANLILKYYFSLFRFNIIKLSKPKSLYPFFRSHEIFPTKCFFSK